MALSGSSEAVLVENALGSKTWLRFDWKVLSMSKPTNSSQVSWSLVFYAENGGFSTSGNADCSISIEGASVFNGTVNSNLGVNESKTLTSNTTTIYHTADGSKTFSFSFTVNFGPLSPTRSGSGTGTLDPIDRQATITGAVDFTDEENPTITYSNPSGDAATTLEACISFTGAKDDVPYRSIPKTGTSYTFELSDNERKILREGVADKLKSTVYFYIRCTIRGNTYHSNISKTLSIVNCDPTLNPTVKDTNARTVALTGNNQKFIKYYSNAYFETGATAHKEATIASQSVSNAGLTIENQASGTFVGVRSNTFYFGMVDSRGLSDKDFKIIDFIPYIKLTSSLSLGLLTANGTVDFTIKGKYFEGSFGAKDNAMEVEYSVRDKDGNYVFNNGDEGSGWVKLGVVAPDVNDGNYTYTHTIEGLDYTQQYTITVNVIDALTPVQTVSSVVAALPVFDWNGDDFHHHTDIVFSNDKRVMGMTANDEQIVALEPCDSEGDTTLGRGNYDSGEGDTRIFGNNIYLTPKEKIIINGKEYGAQRVLWSGASHMNASQTVSLAQTISEQPNGVVLVFSLYRDGAAEDVSFNTFFVSKHEVGLFPGDPHSFFMLINAGFSTVGAKYLYINDESIGGHEGNTQSGTASGITFNNSYFVLRYVIGV